MFANWFYQKEDKHSSILMTGDEVVLQPGRRLPQKLDFPPSHKNGEKE
jgi:hypothetical protein